MLCDVCDTVEAYLCVVGVDDALLVGLPLDWQELDEDGWCGEWLSLGEELDVLVPELVVCDADGCDAVTDGVKDLLSVHGIVWFWSL